MHHRSSLIKPIVSILLGLMLLGLLPNSELVAHADRGAAQADPPPAPSAQHSIYLPLVSTSGPNQSGPSSQELIDAALARGELDAETALIYQVFATFGDPRLPSQYQGNDSQPSDREILGELAERFATLSPQAKAILEPFTIPAYYPGSWWDLRYNSAPGTAGLAPAATRCGQSGSVVLPLNNQWHSIESAGGKVKIWWQARYPEDALIADGYAKKIDAIWNELARLMRRAPPSDQGSTLSCRGGDDRLDISLVDLANNGEAWPYSSAPEATASYLLISRKAKIGTVIHELMHCFQFAYDVAGTVSEYRWWREATATWAVNYIDKALNHEHGYASYMLDVPELPLETYASAGTGQYHQYGAYVFPWFVQLHTGKPDFVRTSWEFFEARANSLEAIDLLLLGGFKDQWPEFTLRMLNRPPMDDFAKNDALKSQAKFKLDEIVTLNGAPDRSYVLDGEVAHLSSHAFRFTFNTPEARSVYFINPFYKGDWPTASVRALLKIDNTWRTENWTSDGAAGFCRDLKAERLQELILVISNSEWKDRSHKLRPAETPRLNVTNVACRGWTFSMTATREETGDQTDIDEQTTVTGKWIRRKFEGEVRVDRPFEAYWTTEAKATWNHDGNDNGCAGSGSGTVALNSSEQTWLAIYTHATDKTGRIYQQGTRRYNGFGGDTPAFLSQKVIYHCPNGSTREEWLGSVGAWFFTETEPTQFVSVDGKQIKGIWIKNEYDPHTNYRTTYTYEWTMTALPPE